MTSKKQELLWGEFTIEWRRKDTKELFETSVVDDDDSLESESDSDDEDYKEKFDVVKMYCGKVESVMENMVEKCERMKNEKNDLRDKYHQVIAEGEKRLEKMQQEKVEMRLHFQNQIGQLTCDHKKQVETLKAEILEKQKVIDEMKDMQVKQANIKQLNEERVKSKKELEDMEDALSKEIKTLQMRKLFVHNLQTKIKPAPTEEDYKQEIITKGYSLAMEKLTALRSDIGKLQDSVRQ